MDELSVSSWHENVFFGYHHESEKSIYLVITEMLLALRLQGVRKK